MTKQPSRPSIKHKTLRGSIALLALLALALVGCRPQPPEVPDSVDRVGVVLLSQPTETSVPSGQATFVELTAARAEELMASPFGAQVGTCQVSTASAPSSDNVMSSPSGNKLIGSNVRLRVGAADYGILGRGPDGRYTMSAASSPLPDAGLNLQLTATGAFPAFNKVAIATGKPPVLAPGFDASDITVNTVFNWTPGTVDSAIILVGSDGAVAFSCVVEDALGTFVFPADTRSELTVSGFNNGSLNTIGRITTTQARARSALLIVGALRLVNLGTER